MGNPITDVVAKTVNGLIAKVADKIFPDAAQKEQFQLEMQKELQAMDMAELDMAKSAIVAEAQSTDKWTSRARPSFLYVMYLIILASIPMGILTSINPQVAVNIANGFKSWLGAIPDSMWALFGTGYLGYSASRSYDKHMELKHGKK